MKRAHGHLARVIEMLEAGRPCTELSSFTIAWNRPRPPCLARSGSRSRRFKAPLNITSKPARDIEWRTYQALLASRGTATSSWAAEPAQDLECKHLVRRDDVGRDHRRESIRLPGAHRDGLHMSTHAGAMLIARRRYGTGNLFQRCARRDARHHPLSTSPCQRT